MWGWGRRRICINKSRISGKHSWAGEDNKSNRLNLDKEFRIDAVVDRGIKGVWNRFGTVLVRRGG